MKDKLFKLCMEKGVTQMVEAAVANPALAMPRFRHEVIKDTERLTGRQIPHLSELGREPSPVGLTVLGHWGRGHRYRVRQSAVDWLLIDWHQLLRLSSDIIRMGFPMASLLGWLMSREPVARRMLWLSELLERDLITEFGGFWLSEWPSERYPPLQLWETHAKRNMLESNLRSLRVLDTVRSSFRHHFRPVTTDVGRLDTDTKDLLRKLYPGDNHWQRRLSVVSLSRSSQATRLCKGPLVSVGLNHTSFLDAPKKETNPIGYELSYLLRCNNAEEQGVLLVKEPTPYGPNPIMYIVVYMGRYADYRTKAGCEYFRDFRRKEGLETHSYLSLGARLVDEFVKRYPRLYDADMHALFTKKRADSRFHADVKREDLWVMRRSTLRELLDKRRRLEIYRDDTLPQLPRNRGKRVVPKPFLIESPPFRSLNNDKMWMWAVHWYGKNYYRPAWSLPDDMMYKTPKQSVTNLRPGVLIHEENFYVTLALLVEAKIGDIHRSADAMTWLQNVDVASEMKLDILKRQSVVLARERFGSKVPEAVKRAPYTEKENHHIVKDYRPGMTKEDITVLKNNLPGRSWLSIQKQATYLCKLLIQQGVWNPANLPHRRMSNKMFEMIRDEIKAHNGIPMMRINGPEDIESEDGDGEP